MNGAAAAIWGSGTFERIAAGASASHDALIDALPLEPGTRMLDVATGTGALALRAAAQGARVTGVDIAPALLDCARSAAADAKLEVEFRVGDAERLPFASCEFDVVASAQGAVFAADRTAVARELARVCRPGGTVALSCPMARGFPFELARMLSTFRLGSRGAWLAPFAWGSRGEVERLLGHAFDLRFDELDAPFRARTPDGGWTVYSESFGPLNDVFRSLDNAPRSELRRRVIELLGRYATPSGVAAPRPLLLVVGRRR